MSYRTVISTSDLAGHVDGTWAIVDCRFDLQDETWGWGEYRKAHVPSAVYASLSRDLSGATTGANGRHPLPSPEQMIRVFSDLGIDRHTQVVAYDQDAGMFASRLWWMLRYLGHEAVAVLDGGWAAWIREGRPARSGVETRPASPFEGTPRPELIASLEEVAAASEHPARLLVDARAPERYEGQSETIDRVAGHIPGAVNHFFRNNLNADGSMRPADALRAAFAPLVGTAGADRTIMYCGSGVTACQNLLAMEHAGLRGARLYPGSWSEWSSDAARPVETGPARPQRAEETEGTERTEETDSHGGTG